MPEAMRAVCDQHRPEIQRFRQANEECQEEDPKITYHFNGDKFFVNGEAIEQDITPLTFREMISLHAETLDAMEQLQFSTGGPIDEKSSIFQAFAINVTSLDDIDLAYMRVCQVKKYADHIVLAYRLKNSEGFKEGSSSDKEHYGDQEVLKIIHAKHAVNIAVFVSREYGGCLLVQSGSKLLSRLPPMPLRMQNPKLYLCPRSLTMPGLYHNVPNANVLMETVIDVKVKVISSWQAGVGPVVEMAIPVILVEGVVWWLA